MFSKELNEAMTHTSDADLIESFWKEKRLGKFTSSQIAKLMIKGKSDYFGEGALTYIYKKVGEVITQEANEVSSKAIEFGNEHEENAVLTFARMFEKEIEYYGKKAPLFIEHGKHAGGSPDGFVTSENAVLETKVPYESGYHAEVFHKIKMKTFDLAKYEKEYYGQVQMNIHLTKADFGYFVSYDPRVVDFRYSIAYAKIERDDKYITELLERIEKATEVKIQLLTDLGFYSAEEIAKAA